MPDLYSLLKQFNAIGGMAQTGQSGFCLLMALWQKANELNWTDRFTMTNAELLYKAGFNCEKTLIEVRNKLNQLGYFKYVKPKNRRYCGTYTLNYDLLSLSHYLPKVSSETHSLPGVSSNVSSEVNSDVNSGVSSGVNINKLNETKQTDISNDISGASPKKKKTPNPDVKVFLDYYYEQFTNHFNSPPVVDYGKDGAIIKRLLSIYSLDKLKLLLDKFFRSSDSFITDSGYTIGAFKSQINKLIAKGAKQRQLGPPNDAYRPFVPPSR